MEVQSGEGAQDLSVSVDGYTEVNHTSSVELLLYRCRGED